MSETQGSQSGEMPGWLENKPSFEEEKRLELDRINDSVHPEGKRARTEAYQNMRKKIDAKGVQDMILRWNKAGTPKSAENWDRMIEFFNNSPQGKSHDNMKNGVQPEEQDTDPQDQNN